MDKLALSNLLDEKINDLVSWLGTQDDKNFDQTYKKDKWTVGQHVQHLIITNRAINNGMKMPKLLLRWKFGKNNRVERSYEDTFEKYNTALKANTAKAPERFNPRIIQVEEKVEKTKQLIELKEDTKKILDKWSESQLSKYVLPHPLIGKMSIREFVLFISLHTDHHLNILKRDYSSL